MPSESGLTVRLRTSRPGASSFSLDASFSAPPGITILFGPSGAGKSTTLASIAGLVRPDEGRIALGDDVWLDTAEDVFRPPETRGVAFVFQSLALFPHMSALQNVAFGVARKVPRRERQIRAREMLGRMRVSHLEDRRPRTYSGGEAQRVALARAFAMAPRVVLLDEAFSAMDRELRAELLVDVRRYVKEVGIPAIHVTHHRNEARAMGDRAVILRHGRVEAEGRIEDLIPRLGPTPGASEDLFAELDHTPLPELER